MNEWKDFKMEDKMSVTKNGPVSVATETAKQQIAQGIRKLVDRWTKCVAKQGDYVEK
jgi:hypothetical protein